MMAIRSAVSSAIEAAPAAQLCVGDNGGIFPTTATIPLGAWFRIEGYLSANKKTITTAFPIYKKK